MTKQADAHGEKTKKNALDHDKPRKVKVARLQSEFCTKDFFSSHEFSYEKCSEIFPENFEPLFCGSEKNPGKFPPNFPLNFPNFPAKNQKISPTSFCRSAGRKKRTTKKLTRQVLLAYVDETSCYFLHVLCHGSFFDPLWCRLQQLSWSSAGLSLKEIPAGVAPALVKVEESSPKSYFAAFLLILQWFWGSRRATTSQFQCEERNTRAACLQNEIAPEKLWIDTKNGLKNAKKDPENDPKRVWKKF